MSHLRWWWTLAGYWWWSEWQNRQNFGLLYRARIECWLRRGHDMRQANPFNARFLMCSRCTRNNNYPERDHFEAADKGYVDDKCVCGSFGCRTGYGTPDA